MALHKVAQILSRLDEKKKQLAGFAAQSRRRKRPTPKQDDLRSIVLPRSGGRARHSRTTVIQNAKGRKRRRARDEAVHSCARLAASSS